jgi:hypothetical protein
MSSQNKIRKKDLDELRKEVLAGIKQLDQGKSKELDESAAERIKARGRKMLRSE